MGCQWSNATWAEKTVLNNDSQKSIGWNASGYGDGFMT